MSGDDDELRKLYAGLERNGNDIQSSNSDLQDLSSREGTEDDARWEAIGRQVYGQLYTNTYHKKTQQDPTQLNCDGALPCFVKYYRKFLVREEEFSRFADAAYDKVWNYANDGDTDDMAVEVREMLGTDASCLVDPAKPEHGIVTNTNKSVQKGETVTVTLTNGAVKTYNKPPGDPNFKLEGSS